jgi:hypothetical protein
MADAILQRGLASLARFGALVFLIVTAGCQQSPTTVAGAVTLDGKPLGTDANSRGTVVFQPLGGQGTTSTGLLDAKGNFKLAVGASPEIAPGKYHVAVSLVELVPASEGAERGGKRVTPAKYASPGTSGLQADVVPGPNDFQFALVSASDDAAEPSNSITPPAITPTTDEPAHSTAVK